MMLMMVKTLLQKDAQLNNLRLENHLKSWRSPIKVDDGMNEEMDVEDGEVVENGEDGENGEADLDLMVRVTVSRMRNRFSERSSSERNFGLEETFRTQHKNWLRS